MLESQNTWVVARNKKVQKEMTVNIDKLQLFEFHRLQSEHLLCNNATRGCMATVRKHQRWHEGGSLNFDLTVTLFGFHLILLNLIDLEYKLEALR